MRCDCEPFVFTASTGPSAVASGGTIPLGRVIRQRCDSVRLNGDGIICRGPRAYQVSANVTLAPSNTQVVTVSLEQDGTKVPGATASALVGGTITLPIDVVIRVDGRQSSVLTLVSDGADATVSNCTVTVRPV